MSVKQQPQQQQLQKKHTRYTSFSMSHLFNYIITTQYIKRIIEYIINLPVTKKKGICIDC